jgi:hypothetical protein
MTRIVVGSINLTQPLLLYPNLRSAMLEQHRRSQQLSMLYEKMISDFGEGKTDFITLISPFSFLLSVFLAHVPPAMSQVPPTGLLLVLVRGQNGTKYVDPGPGFAHRRTGTHGSNPCVFLCTKSLKSSSLTC